MVPVCFDVLQPVLDEVRDLEGSAGMSPKCCFVWLLAASFHWMRPRSLFLFFVTFAVFAVVNVVTGTKVFLLQCIERLDIPGTKFSWTSPPGVTVIQHNYIYIYMACYLVEVKFGTHERHKLVWQHTAYVCRRFRGHSHWKESDWQGKGVRGGIQSPWKCDVHLPSHKNLKDGNVDLSCRTSQIWL